MQQSVPYFYKWGGSFGSIGADPAGLLMVFPWVYLDHWSFGGRKMTLCSIDHEAARGARSFVQPQQNARSTVPIFNFRAKKWVQSETPARSVPAPLFIRLPAVCAPVLYPKSVPKNFETGYRKYARNSVKKGGRHKPCRNVTAP